VWDKFGSPTAPCCTQLTRVEDGGRGKRATNVVNNSPQHIFQGGRRSGRTTAYTVAMGTTQSTKPKKKKGIPQHLGEIIASILTHRLAPASAYLIRESRRDRRALSTSTFPTLQQAALGLVKPGVTVSLVPSFVRTAGRSRVRAMILLHYPITEKDRQFIQGLQSEGVVRGYDPLYGSYNVRNAGLRLSQRLFTETMEYTNSIHLYPSFEELVNNIRARARKYVLRVSEGSLEYLPDEVGVGWAWGGGAKAAQAQLVAAKEVHQANATKAEQYTQITERERLRVAQMEETIRMAGSKKGLAAKFQKLQREVCAIPGVADCYVNGPRLVVRYYPALCRAVPVEVRRNIRGGTGPGIDVVVPPVRLVFTPARDKYRNTWELSFGWNSSANGDRLYSPGHPHVGCYGHYGAELKSAGQAVQILPIVGMIAQWRRTHGAGSYSRPPAEVARGNAEYFLRNYEGPHRLDVDGRIANWRPFLPQARPEWFPSFDLSTYCLFMQSNYEVPSNVLLYQGGSSGVGLTHPIFPVDPGYDHGVVAAHQWSATAFAHVMVRLGLFGSRANEWARSWNSIEASDIQARRVLAVSNADSSNRVTTSVNHTMAHSLMAAHSHELLPDRDTVMGHMDRYNFAFNSPNYYWLMARTVANGIVHMGRHMAHNEASHRALHSAEASHHHGTELRARLIQQGIPLHPPTGGGGRPADPPAFIAPVPEDTVPENPNEDDELDYGTEEEEATF